MSEKAATSVTHAYSVGKKQCSEEEEQIGSVKKNRLESSEEQLISNPGVSLLCLK